MPDWKALTSARIASTVACAELQADGCSRSTADRRSVPNISPSAFSASTMPSEKKTSTSPGLVCNRLLFVLRVGKEAQREALDFDGVHVEAVAGRAILGWTVRARLPAGGGVSVTVLVTYSGCTEPALAICSVRVSSFHTAISMVTYCESSLRSCSWLFSSASRSAGGRWRAASERRMPETSAAYSAAGAALPETSPSTMAMRLRLRRFVERVAGRAVVDEVVDVAADGARGQEGRRDLRAARLRRRAGQQAELHLARHRQVALQPLLLFGDALVEPRIRDRDGHLRGQRGERGLVVLVVVVDARVFEVDHADDLALVDQRHGELGAHLGVGDDVARVLAHVGHQDAACAAARRGR